MKKFEKGFSVLEVILAASAFVVFSSAAVVAVISGLDNNRLGAEMTVANQFNTEGLEAVRSIKNQSWTTFVNKADAGDTGVSNGSGTWVFNGTSDTLSFDTRFNRVINITSVLRDAEGNIVTSGGTDDPDTKKVTVTTSWNFTSSRPESIVLTNYMSNWKAPVGYGNLISMMVYSKTTSTPFYRIWDGVSWSEEASAQDVGGNINYVVLRSSRTRNEAILGTLDSGGNIYIQVWNGSSWGSLTQIANIGAVNADTRSFDIEYEKSGDRAIIVYLPDSTSSDFAYRYWDGSSLSTPSVITTPPTTGLIKWIELAANPISSSNEIAMIMFDANADVYGMGWDGSSWGNMGDSAVWDANASSSISKKAIDVAYEQVSGRAMFVWADSVTTDQYYRIWNGANLTTASLLDISTSGGRGEWVKLVSRPDSNEMLYGVQDAGADLNTRKWSGSAWDTGSQHPEHDAAVENTTSMNFDLVWETHSANSGKAWLVWGDGATVSRKQGSGTTWQWGSPSTFSGSDDTSFIRLKADSGSGAIFAGVYADASAKVPNRNIWESHLIDGGSSWSGGNIVWGGQTGGTPVYFRIDITTR